MHKAFVQKIIEQEARLAEPLRKFLRKRFFSSSAPVGVFLFDYVCISGDMHMHAARYVRATRMSDWRSRSPKYVPVLRYFFLYYMRDVDAIL